MKKKKEITLDDLAVMVKRGFDETAKKVDLINLTERVGNIEKELKKEINEVRHDISLISALPARLEHRVDVLYDDMRLVKTQIGLK
jgi:hypothetical protein